LESLVQELDFVSPAAVGSTLLVGIQEVLPAVEDPVWSGRSCNSLQRLGSDMGKSSVESSNLQQARKTQEQGGSAACLQDHFVGKDEHARLRKKIGIDMFGLDDREDFAVNKIKHLLPGISGHDFESKGTSLSRQVGGRRTEPYF
jgi:hypothetical protein